MNSKLPDSMTLSHILVEHRYEAEDLERKLRDGESFEDLAKKFSTCPSRLQGGSLGHIELSRLEPIFAEAAAALRPGEISPVVRTPFGHHLIRNDARD